MPKIGKTSLALFISLLLLLSPLVPSASAQIFWSTPVEIDQSTNYPMFPATVTGPNGYFHTIWSEFDQASPPDTWLWGDVNPGIFYSYWNGDAWSVPVKVSQNDKFAGFPTLVVTSDNKINALWEDDSTSPSGSYGRILYSSSTNYGSTWSTPISIAESLDSQPGAWAWIPHVVTDSNNNLHAVFIYGNDSTNGWGGAYYTKYDGASWSTPTQLVVKQSDEGISDMAIAVDSSNNPHVLIREDGIGSWDPYLGIWYTSFNGSIWSTPAQLSTTGEAPRLVIDNNNNRHAVWTSLWFDDANQTYKSNVEYLKGNGGGWSPSPTLITNQANRSFLGYPIVGVTFDSQNNVFVGWGERVGWESEPWKGTQVSYKKWSNSSQAWSNSIFMRYAYDLSDPFIYRDKWDNQHFAWVEQDSVSKGWSLWYSTVPINAQAYNPTQSFSMTFNVSNDTLTIPASALATPATISAQIGPLPASANPAYTTLPRSFTFRPHGTTFINNKKATATINYTDSEIIGADERNMKLYIWDSSLNSWSTGFPTSINRTQNKATVTLDHFSLYGFMAPKAEREMQLTWKPPIANSELYTMTDGSTVPIKFTLTYTDGSSVPQPASSEDLIIYIRNTDYMNTPEGEQPVPSARFKEFRFGSTDNEVRFDSAGKQFLLSLRTKDLNLNPDTYFIKVIYKNITVGNNSFRITEPGKVKGVATP